MTCSTWRCSRLLPVPSQTFARFAEVLEAAKQFAVRLLDPALTYPLPAGDPPDNLLSRLSRHCLHDLMCSNRKSGWKPQIYALPVVRRFSRLAYCYSGEVEGNPGPGPHHPYGYCSKAVR